MSIKRSIAKRASRRGGTLTRGDLNNLGNYRSVSRALSELVSEGLLVRTGRGQYKAAINAPGELSFDTLSDRIREQVLRENSPIFLRKDFRYPNVSKEAVRKAISKLQNEGVILRIGQGIYTRAKRSPFNEGLMPQHGFSGTIAAVAGRLGRQIIEDDARRAYNSGTSNQIPTGRYVELSGAPMRRVLKIGKGIVKMVARG
ncbi:MAG: DUF6088 family protein [Aquisalimonadaceae bacterium]